MMIKLKLWFSQLTLGTAISAVVALVTILARNEAVSFLVLIGLSQESALHVQKLAVGLMALILLYSRSPKNTPLFSTPAQRADMPHDQKDAVIVAKEQAKEAALKP